MLEYPDGHCILVCMATTRPHNTVRLLQNNIIYVEKVGDQTADSMTALYDQVKELAAELRRQNKPVLILSNAQKEGEMDSGARKVATKIGKDLDYDKSATYTPSLRVRGLRELMVMVTDLGQKVANFDTRAEALAWLLNQQS